MTMAALTIECACGHDFFDFFVVAGRASRLLVSKDQIFKIFFTCITMKFVNRHYKQLLIFLKKLNAFTHRGELQQRPLIDPYG